MNDFWVFINIVQVFETAKKKRMISLFPFFSVAATIWFLKKLLHDLLDNDLMLELKVHVILDQIIVHDMSFIEYAIHK